LHIAIALRHVLVQQLPASVRGWARELAACPPGTRLAFVRCWVARRRRDVDAVPPQLVADSSIVFVCSGNIIRSPLAEALLRRRLAEAGYPATRICSAGLHATLGRAADPRAAEIAQAAGISLVEHAAQPLTRELIDAAGAIFVMDFRNEAELVTRHPSAAGKVVLLGALARDAGTGSPSIPDPYALDDAAVRAAFARIDAATRALAATLSARSRILCGPPAPETRGQP
jgi:low molecular weight protein-tyrosine phosphatase